MNIARYFSLRFQVPGTTGCEETGVIAGILMVLFDHSWKPRMYNFFAPALRCPYMKPLLPKTGALDPENARAPALGRWLLDWKEASHGAITRKCSEKPRDCIKNLIDPIRIRVGQQWIPNNCKPIRERVGLNREVLCELGRCFERLFGHRFAFTSAA